MINRRGLGRGLGALLASEPAEAESLLELPIDSIEVNPNQPRKVFDFTALDELAASIKASGVIQPIIVRRVASSYQLIAGERRAKRGSTGSLRSSAMRPTRRASSSPWSRTCCAKISIRSRPRRPIRSSWPNSDGRRKSWPSGSARTGRRSPTRCDSCGYRRKSRLTFAAGVSRWAMRVRCSR